jgi:hypothetical protein
MSDNADSAVRRNMEAFVQQMLHVTVNLVRVDLQMSPCGLCSGVLVDRNGDVFILSAYHGLKKGRYCLETNLVLKGSAQTVLIPLNGVFHTERIVLRPGAFEIEKQEEIDFAWSKLDIDAARQKMANDPMLTGMKIELPIYNGPLADIPEKDTPYGYAAWNRGLIIDGYARFLERHSSYELGLEFDGREPTTNLYKFRLARPHQGKDYYEGASGAPIADHTGKIVSLLIGGVGGSDLLLGLPLSEYVKFIDL